MAAARCSCSTCSSSWTSTGRSISRRCRSAGPSIDEWSQLILKQTGDKVELISKAPASGIWRMAEDGSIKFVRRTLDWTNVTGENEAFYLRVYTGGDYRYHGADLGILVTRGRMQTDERRLLERAKKWNAGINGQFQCVPLPPEMPVHPPEADSINKMY